MAHFAKLDQNNIVIFVTVGRDEDEGNEDQLTAQTGEVYKQTSYNTSGGVHFNRVTQEPSVDQSKALRKNYAGLGDTYDYARDAFIAPQPFASWILNENTCQWEAPVEFPTDGNINMYVWNEVLISWVRINL